MSCESVYLVDVVSVSVFFFFFQAEDGIRDLTVTGVQTCALPISTLRETPSCSATCSARPRSGPSPISTSLAGTFRRSEEHTSELQSQSNLVCRLLLEKKKRNAAKPTADVSIA